MIIIAARKLIEHSYYWIINAVANTSSSQRDFHFIAYTLFLTAFIIINFGFATTGTIVKKCLIGVTIGKLINFIITLELLAIIMN